MVDDDLCVHDDDLVCRECAARGPAFCAGRLGGSVVQVCAVCAFEQVAPLAAGARPHPGPKPEPLEAGWKTPKLLNSEKYRNPKL